MTDRSDQFTQDSLAARGELQDDVAVRDGKAEVLADAVIEREALEKNTAYMIVAGLVFLLVVCFSALAYGLHETSVVADSNQRVVCNLRAGYEESLESSKKFLKANPNGGTLLGVEFTRNDLLKQIAAYKKRLASTADAVC